MKITETIGYHHLTKEGFSSWVMPPLDDSMFEQSKLPQRRLSYLWAAFNTKNPFWTGKENIRDQAIAIMKGSDSMGAKTNKLVALLQNAPELSYYLAVLNGQKDTKIP